MVGYAGRGLTVVAVSAKGSTQPATHGRPRQSEADAQWAAISKHGRICIVGPVVLSSPSLSSVVFPLLAMSPVTLGHMSDMSHVSDEMCTH